MFSLDAMVGKIRARKTDITARLNHARNQMAGHQQKVREFELTAKYLEGAMEDLVYFERMACGVKTPAA